MQLSRTSVTAAGLKELAALKQLRYLRLAGANVTDAGLKELAALKQLQSLDLFDCSREVMAHGERPRPTQARHRPGDPWPTGHLVPVNRVHRTGPHARAMASHRLQPAAVAR